MFLLIGFLVATVAASLHRDRAGMGVAYNIKEHWKTCYLQTEDIEKRNALAGPVYPVSQHQNLKEKLEYFKKTTRTCIQIRRCHSCFRIAVEGVILTAFLRRGNADWFAKADSGPDSWRITATRK
jgi:hypothetical protein